MKTHPDFYHGTRKKRNFFEGWYFKITDRTGSHALALIPGIALGNSPSENHAFLQIINGVDTNYCYHRFPESAFKSEKESLDIEIEGNRFSFEGFQMSVTAESGSIHGKLDFSPPVRWPESKLNPGSMGFYNHLFFMECYSQVCAVDGKINSGSLTINDKIIDFSGGKYYIEKNWGRSFPKAWIWIQSNNFPDNSASVTVSLGVVPFPVLKAFRGFLIGVTLGNEFYAFTTINRSTLRLKRRDQDILLTSKNKNLELTLKTKSSPVGFVTCHGPTNGGMAPLLKETLSGEVEMTLTDLASGKVLYQGIGKATGIEYGGDQELLTIEK